MVLVYSKRKRMETGGMMPRKRARVFSNIRQFGRSVVLRSCHTLRSRDLYLRSMFHYNLHPSPVVHVKIGDTIDIFPLLGDFLISSNHDRNNEEVRVRVDDIRGKTILLYMMSLRVYCIPGGFSGHTNSLVAILKERDFDFEFEVVFVPVNRGPDFLQNCAMNRFNDFFAKMPCLAVPFANKRACDLVQDTFLPHHNRDYINPGWALIDPSGKVLLTSEFSNHIFNNHGIGELVPLMHKMLPSLVDAQRKSKYSTQSILCRLFLDYDQAPIQGIINLNKLLPHYLFTKDGNKVHVSVLKDKVVGLYFCNHISSEHSRIQSIKKIYEEIGKLGYDFEIVQINYHSSGCLKGNPYGYQNVPWLTSPYMHSRFKRLIRIFHCYSYGTKFPDRLVIINPHESNLKENRFFDRHGADTIHHFGIEGYPFTMRRVVELESARRREEINLRLIFGHHPLLRRRGGSYDQVPVSQLWGKRVLLLFATYPNYKPCKYMITLKSNYLEQNDVNVFEIVYISCDTNAFNFDDCTADMPWLVHPYSWEFAHTWLSKIFTTHDDMYSLRGTWCGMVNFHNGEFVSKNDLYESDGDSDSDGENDYPFFRPNALDDVILRDIMEEYGGGGFSL